MPAVRPGQELQVRWRTASGLVLENILRFGLSAAANGGREVPCYVTFKDENGVSVYLARGAELGGDMEAFFPRYIHWPAYFEPLMSHNRAYSGSRHYRKVFPRDFLGS